MKLYADTSLFISYYVSDSNSTRAESLIEATTSPFLFTDLHRLEMRNAMALGLFRRILTPAQITAAWKDVRHDLRAGRLRPEIVHWTPIFRAAAQWATTHTPIVGSRSLDVLHVAAAKKLEATEFFTFDIRQKALADAIGLNVKP